MVVESELRIWINFENNSWRGKKENACITNSVKYGYEEIIYLFNQFLSLVHSQGKMTSKEKKLIV